ncbi:MAG: prepilin-type N-terminal cleavage/methylation domain-containing protein [Verrucomicrobia bacterium]|nr:prepilin-type N-terminal cleavage/methylation domain-containing protein [Verrucomicrobiota bacterium]MCH8526571.1 prepilin-type N-terminal cleavage/methylation domain-containing protein [Kiritimatiellia bacterium]
MTRISAPPTERRLRDQGRDGFSLLEILVCLLLLGILAVGFSQVFQGSLSIGQIQGAEGKLIRDRREAVRHQFAEVEGAEAVIELLED